MLARPHPWPGASRRPRATSRGDTSPCGHRVRTRLLAKAEAKLASPASFSSRTEGSGHATRRPRWSAGPHLRDHRRVRRRNARLFRQRQHHRGCRFGTPSHPSLAARTPRCQPEALSPFAICGPTSMTSGIGCSAQSGGSTALGSPCPSVTAVTLQSDESQHATGRG